MPLAPWKYFQAQQKAGWDKISYPTSSQDAAFARELDAIIEIETNLDNPLLRDMLF